MLLSRDGKEMFESRVISDGSQTWSLGTVQTREFESRVISDGSQTSVLSSYINGMFESRVISDGSQTFLVIEVWRVCLRVV